MQHASHSVHFFSFPTANIDTRINNKNIFKFSIPGLLKNCLTFNPGWLEGWVMVAQKLDNVFLKLFPIGCHSLLLFTSPHGMLFHTPHFESLSALVIKVFQLVLRFKKNSHLHKSTMYHSGSFASISVKWGTCKRDKGSKGYVCSPIMTYMIMSFVQKPWHMHTNHVLFHWKLS